MNTRLRARGREETPTTGSRRGLLEDVDNLKVLLAILSIKVIFACRALISPCPDLGSGPQVDLQPFLQPRNGAEVRQYVPRQRPLDGTAADLRFSLDCPHGRVTVSLKGLHEPLNEDLTVDRRDRSAIAQSASGPTSPSDVLARGSVSSGPGHALSVSPKHGMATVASPHYGCDNGSYRSHNRERCVCRGTWSSEVTS